MKDEHAIPGAPTDDDWGCLPGWPKVHWCYSGGGTRATHLFFHPHHPAFGGKYVYAHVTSGKVVRLDVREGP